MNEGMQQVLTDQSLQDLVVWIFGVLIMTAPVIFYFADKKLKKK